MMRAVTRGIGRGITTAALTALAAAGVFGAVAGSVAATDGDGTVVSKPCHGPKDPACKPANGWQERRNS